MCVSLSLILMLSLMISVLFVFASFLSEFSCCCFGGGGVYVSCVKKMWHIDSATYSSNSLE